MQRTIKTPRLKTNSGDSDRASAAECKVNTHFLKRKQKKVAAVQLITPGEPTSNEVRTCKYVRVVRNATAE